MGYFNHNVVVIDNGEVKLTPRPSIGYGPIGGNYGEDAYKNVFFTNMYAQSQASCPLMDKRITSIVFEDAQENNISKDELPTYRS
jgi:hypothetical protein